MSGDGHGSRAIDTRAEHFDTLADSYMGVVAGRHAVTQRSTPLSLMFFLHFSPYTHSSQARARAIIPRPPKIVNVQPTPMLSINTSTRAVPPPARKAPTMLFAACAVEGDLG